MGDSIVSAGIDIGTSTTHLTISRLHFGNVAGPNRVPTLAVIERRILYQSQIYATPLNVDDSIDAEAVAELLSREYRSAEISANEIDTGAVIITGESARRRNARQVTLAISEMAGDFVVASAGCHLESILAGRGSGAAEASRAEAKTICNIDIGGGTCNYAVFNCGTLVDTACLGIGGRCIQFENNGRLVKFTESGETFLEGVGKFSLLKPAGQEQDVELLELIAALLSEVILYAATSAQPPKITQLMLETDPLKHDSYKIDEYWFSGGVAECMSRPELSTYAFGDFGIYLGRALRAALAERQLNYKISNHGIRATVIGAGMHNLQLSGCTIMIAPEVLPLRNVQIVRPFAPTDAGLTGEEIAKKISTALFKLDSSGEEDSAQHIAIQVCDLSLLSYAELQVWAKTLADSHRIHRPGTPLIILSREDIALALGQTLRSYAADIDLLVLDSVDTSRGDFIDIGRSLENQQSVPLTVKTLIFNQ